MRRTSMIGLVVFALFISTAALAAVPQTLHYSGKLNTAGGAFTGTIEVTFSLYAGATGGDSLWSEKLAVSVVKGRFDVQLGATKAIKPSDLDVEALYVGVAVGEDDEMPTAGRLFKRDASAKPKMMLCPAIRFDG